MKMVVTRISSRAVAHTVYGIMTVADRVDMV